MLRINGVFSNLTWFLVGLPQKCLNFTAIPYSNSQSYSFILSQDLLKRAGAFTLGPAGHSKDPGCCVAKGRQGLFCSCEDALAFTSQGISRITARRQPEIQNYLPQYARILITLEANPRNTRTPLVSCQKAYFSKLTSSWSLEFTRAGVIKWLRDPFAAN